jgi:hypothetical protein
MIYFLCIGLLGKFCGFLHLTDFQPQVLMFFLFLMVEIGRKTRFPTKKNFSIFIDFFALVPQAEKIDFFQSLPILAKTCFLGFSGSGNTIPALKTIKNASKLDK